MSILEQRLSLVTLGVGDLARAKAFYTGVLGWKAIGNNPGIVFFDLGGLMLALYPHDAAAEDMKTASTELPPYRGFALAYNTRSEAEVDEVFAKLREAAVGRYRLVKRASGMSPVRFSPRCFSVMRVSEFAMTSPAARFG